MGRGVRAAVLSTAGRALEVFRKLTPAALVPALVRVRHRLAWSRSSVRAEAHRQMEFLLAETRPNADLDAVASGYARAMIRRGEERWHPGIVTGRRLEGLEHLVGARDMGRGVIVSFVHHGFYDGGAFPALAHAGVPTHMMIYPYMARDDAAGWIKRHLVVNSLGGGIPTSTEIGTQGIIDLLTRGAVVAIASDVPGRTPMTFVGREVLGSFGAARLAMTTGSPVVLLTSERDERGEHVRLHAPLHPQDFESPQTLLAEMMSRHEKRVLAWPEATDIPLSRWGVPDATGETS